MRRYLLSFYLGMGFLFQFPAIAMRFWMIDDMKIAPARMAAIMGVAAIPWCLKPLYGFMSDAFPICGEHRRPYIFIGCVGSALSWWVMPWTSFSPLVATVFMFTASLSICIADVVVDSILVTIARDETDKGSIQSWSWGLRAAGGLIGALTGGVSADWLGNERTFILTGAIPLFLCTPVVFLSAETSTSHARPMKTIRLVWKAFKTPDVWRTALFLFLINVTPGYGTVFSYYLEEELHFSQMDFTILSVTGYVASMLGTVVYKKFLTNVPFRPLFLGTLILAWILKWSHMILIWRWLPGVPDVVIAAADSVVLTLVGRCILLPMVVLGARVCPEGVEGSLYALLMSITNFGDVVDSEWGAALAGAVGVQRGHFESLWMLVVLCQCIDIIALCAIPLIPQHNHQHNREK